MRIAVLALLLVASAAAAQARSKKARLADPEGAALSSPAASSPGASSPAASSPAASSPAVSPVAAPPARLSVATDARPRLAVTALEAQGVTDAQALAMTDAVVAALSERGLFDVISSRDVAAALSAERQRQLLGVCEGNPEACSSTVGEALSVPFIVSGQLSRIGTVFQLTLQTLDAVKGRPAGRSNRVAPSLEALQQVVPYAAAEATGSPLPPPPSRVVPVTLLTTGALSFVGGAVFGVITLTQERLLNDALCPGGVPADGRCGGVALSPRAFYVAQDEVLVRQKWVSGGLLAAGAALAVLGLLTMPPLEVPGRLSVLVMPTPSGVAVTGGF